MTPPPRTPDQRKNNALNRLEHDTKARIATPASSPTGSILHNTGKVRLGIGPTRDVVLIKGTASEVPVEVADAFATKTGFDLRELTSTCL
jgi:hypothetical protein